MDTLIANDIVSDGLVNDSCNFGYLNFPNYTFSFGKSYLLDGWPWHGGDTLSWIIAGTIDQFSGKLLINDMPYPVNERRQVAWRVGKDPEQGRRLFFHELTVQDGVQHGLKTNAEPYFKTEQEYIKHFSLTIERYQRPLRQLSNEKWRASCAIGLATGHKIFCFPYMLPEIVNMNASHFREIFKILTNAGGLILFPTTAIGLVHPEKLCDEIVPVKHDSGDVVLYRMPIKG